MRRVPKKMLAGLIGRLQGAATPLEDAVTEYNAALAKAGAVLDDAVAEFNGAVADAWAEVESAVETYNTAVTEVNEEIKELANEGEEYWDGKSERWQESEKGDAYRCWLDTLGDVDLEEALDLEGPGEATVDTPEDLPLPDVETAVDTLENLPTEPEEV